jgi:hypothetical protein
MHEISPLRARKFPTPVELKGCVPKGITCQAWAMWSSALTKHPNTDPSSWLLPPKNWANLSRIYSKDPFPQKWRPFIMEKMLVSGGSHGCPFSVIPTLEFRIHLDANLSESVIQRIVTSNNPQKGRQVIKKTC